MHEAIRGCIYTERKRVRDMPCRERIWLAFFMNLFDVFSKFMYTLKNYNLRLLFLVSLCRKERKMFLVKKTLPRTYLRVPFASRALRYVASNLLIEKINRETLSLFTSIILTWLKLNLGEIMLINFASKRATRMFIYSSFYSGIHLQLCFHKNCREFMHLAFHWMSRLLPVAVRPTGFPRSHISHVEAIHSLICCSFISYASSEFYLFSRFSRFPFNTRIWRFLCTFWIFASEREWQWTEL